MADLLRQVIPVDIDNHNVHLLVALTQVLFCTFFGSIIRAQIASQYSKFLISSNTYTPPSSSVLLIDYQPTDQSSVVPSPDGATASLVEDVVLTRFSNASAPPALINLTQKPTWHDSFGPLLIEEWFPTDIWAGPEDLPLIRFGLGLASSLSPQPPITQHTHQCLPTPRSCYRQGHNPLATDVRHRSLTLLATADDAKATTAAVTLVAPLSLPALSSPSLYCRPARSHACSRSDNNPLLSVTRGRCSLTPQGSTAQDDRVPAEEGLPITHASLLVPAAGQWDGADLALSRPSDPLTRTSGHRLADRLHSYTALLLAAFFTVAIVLHALSRNCHWLKKRTGEAVRSGWCAVLQPVIHLLEAAAPDEAQRAVIEEKSTTINELILTILGLRRDSRRQHGVSASAINNLERSVANLASRSAQKDRKIAELSDHLDSAYTTNNTLRQQLDSERASSASVTADFQRKLAVSEKEKATTQAAMAATQSELSSATKTIEGLKCALESESKVAAVAQANLAERSQSLDTLSAVHRSLKGFFNDAKASVVKFTEANKKLQGQLGFEAQRHKEESIALKATVTELNNHLVAKDEVIKKLQADVILKDAAATKALDLQKETRNAEDESKSNQRSVEQKGEGVSNQDFNICKGRDTVHGFSTTTRSECGDCFSSSNASGPVPSVKLPRSQPASRRDPLDSAVVTAKVRGLVSNLPASAFRPPPPAIRPPPTAVHPWVQASNAWARNTLPDEAVLAAAAKKIEDVNRFAQDLDATIAAAEQDSMRTQERGVKPTTTPQASRSPIKPGIVSQPSSPATTSDEEQEGQIESDSDTLVNSPEQSEPKDLGSPLSHSQEKGCADSVPRPATSSSSSVSPSQGRPQRRRMKTSPDIARLKPRNGDDDVVNSIPTGISMYRSLSTSSMNEESRWVSSSFVGLGIQGLEERLISITLPPSSSYGA